MKYVPGSGPKTARIMIVGEAPGVEEEREGEPFIGNAGKTLRAALSQVGIDVDNVYFTNISNYRPPNNKIRAWFDNNGVPNETVIMGLLRLKAEIETIKPNVIVACGNYPLWALTGLAKWKDIKLRDGSKTKDFTGIAQWRGSIVECQLVEGAKVIPTYHPSFISREGFEMHGIFLADLDRVKRESEFPEIILPKKELILDPQGNQRWQVKDRLLSEREGIITFDIEYIGSKLLCVGMTNHRDWATSVATRTQADIDFVRDILTSGIRLNAQNAIFDCSILEWWYKIPVIDYLWYDTMLAAHAINIELPKGLDFLCSIYTDQRFYKDMVDWEKIKKGLQPIEDVLHYNAIDTWTQHEIMEEQLKHDLCDPDLMRTFRFEMSLVKPLWQMSSRGVKIDLERLNSYRQQLDTEIAERETALHMIAGKHINVKSGKQVSDLLFGKLGLRPGKKNKTGPAVDDKTLAEIQIRSNPVQAGVIQLIREIRQRRDLISKFLEIQFDADGRMRGHYNPAGTDTGRLASRTFYPTGTGGNQQNIPRDTTVRTMFITDDD